MTYSEYIYSSFNRFWVDTLVCDYPNVSYTFKDVACKIMQIHETFRNMGIVAGDKVALCGINSSNWGITYLAITTYGTVAVPLLNDYGKEKILQLIEHSDSRVVFSDNNICTINDIYPNKVLSVFSLNDFTVIYDNGGMPLDIDDVVLKDFSKNTFYNSVYRYKPDELISINYTSGTMANPKGAMIPSRAIASNMSFALDVMSMLKEKDCTISLLPMAHMFGIMYDFICAVMFGGITYFPNRDATLKDISKMYKKLHPNVVIVVPVIIERIIKDKVFKYIHNPRFKPFYRVFKPLVDKLVGKAIKTSLGGNFYQMIIGGSNLDKEVEEYLREINFPFTVGYGMTECAPIITYNDYQSFVLGSCGKIAPRMEMRIGKDDEIQVRGENVMLGYYKNEEATKEAFTEDGWLHTGDVGKIDDDGNLFILGRLNTTIIGSDGKNIYPEDIEEVINKCELVQESLVFKDRNGKLSAYVYPNYDKLFPYISKHLTITDVLTDIKKIINEMLPPNQEIVNVIEQKTPFLKTPKMSIRRYLYVYGEEINN